jgi:(p)ppGpp synthase/HD superfamily hydrolase
MATMLGYSDAINHAFAFATKHHDQETRKGTRLPYLIAAPNVAVILARYGQDEQTIVAAIVLDAVEDFLRDGYTPDMLGSRIADKFGADVQATALSIVERRTDDDGVELSPPERKADQLTRLAAAPVRAHWVVAAVNVHMASTLLANLRRTEFPEAVWGRFAAGRAGTIDWYVEVAQRLRAAGFTAPIMSELDAAVRELATYRATG